MRLMTMHARCRPRGRRRHMIITYPQEPKRVYLMSRKLTATSAHYEHCGTVMDNTCVGHGEPVADWTKTRGVVTFNFIQSS